MRIKSLLFKPFILLALSLLAIQGAEAQSTSLDVDSPWDMKLLSETPKYEVVSEEDGVLGIIYKSVDYQGEAKDVFAYYSTPGLLKGDRELDRNLPAVVCAHGGGGKAFEQWVKIWAERGYAAISMDQRGYAALPEDKRADIGVVVDEGGDPVEVSMNKYGESGVRLLKGFKENREEKTSYFTAYDDQSEDWFYQAICDVIAAHSLILSLPEVNPQKSALTGISWGGIITTLVSGLDHRFKAAVPVYGCGFLYETGSMAPQIARGTELTQDRWHDQYDPALYVKDAQMPMLFVNGTNDHHFFIDQWMKTTDLVEDKHYSLVLEMKHSHFAGWEPLEIYSFIDNVLEVNTPTLMPEFTSLSFKKSKVTCSIKSLSDGDRVSIISTTSSEMTEEAKWIEQEIEVTKGKVNAKISEDVQACFISVKMADGNHYSSRVMFR